MFKNLAIENVTFVGKPAYKGSALNTLTSAPITNAKDVQRARQSKWFPEPDVFVSPMRGNLNITAPTITSALDVQRQRQSKWFQEPDFFISTQKGNLLVTLTTYLQNPTSPVSRRVMLVENFYWVRPQKGNLNTLGSGPIGAPTSGDLFCGQDTYGWPPDAAEPPIFPKPQQGFPLVYNGGTPYNPANDVQRQRQVKYFADVETFTPPSKANILLTTFLPYNPNTDVIWRKPQAKFFSEPETFIRPMPRFAASPIVNYTPYSPSTDVRRQQQARWFVDPDIFLRPAPFNALVINGKAATPPIPIVTNKWLDVYDGLNGTFKLAWAEMLSPPAQSYNVYVNDVFYANVPAPGPGRNWNATVSGLTQTSYNAAAIAPTPANGPRPQNMPPTGTVTNSGTYNLKVVAVYEGVETTANMNRAITVSPTSIMLTTPMKRLWPFPNTGLD